eukprot:CAMPEP_0185826506 /NCGR_PEP_ID=MMETSP1322-20130828/31582_1 /TAXON_ID=265543 /ORGANISM="Minutocellus polymorphus, Strain RCC2270" /LENGTH=556 /DNA_ID=CAMNT_0028524235 /DNA_START=60 /DNA_END=1730 /DNA_ORIENTATION=-
MPGLPPRSRSRSPANTPPASPRHIPHAAQPPSPGIGAVSGNSTPSSQSPITIPQGSPRGGKSSACASAAADALAEMAAIAGGLSGLDLGPPASAAASASASPAGGLPPRSSASQPSSPSTAAMATASNASTSGPPPGALRRQDSFGPSPDGTNPKHPNVPPPPPELDTSAKHIPLPDEHTRRTMEGEAMIFKPKKIRQPSSGATKGGDSSSSKSITTAKTSKSTDTSGGSKSMSHRRHPSLPNLADSRRLRSDLLHKLGIDNSKAMAAGGMGGMQHKPPGANLPPGAVGGSSQTGRTSLLGGVASHDEPLKYREDRAADALERNAWKRFFGLGNNDNNDNNNDQNDNDDNDSGETDGNAQEGGNTAATDDGTSGSGTDKPEEQKMELEMEPDSSEGGENDKQEDGGDDGGGNDAAQQQQHEEVEDATAAAAAAAAAESSTAEEEKENTAADVTRLDPSSTHIVPTTLREKKRITFREQVRVTPIPMRSEYSHRIRDRLWTNRIELHENAQRNALEFSSEGWDWRTVTEDEGMYRCSVSGELIHPVHCQQNYENYEY